MSDQRDQQWDRYLARWDIAALQALTLEQYCVLADGQSLSHWLLKETEALGDFKEGPLSMGIRTHSHGVAKPSNAYNRYDDQYVWLNMLGDTAEEAFASLKSGLLEAAEAGRTGQLERLDALTRQPGALMRKVAFLYQDRQRPCLLPIYDKSVLSAAAGEGAPRTTSALNRLLLAHRGDLTLWTYADELMQQAGQRRASLQAIEQTLTRFRRDPRLAKALRTPEERQLFHRLAQALHAQGLDWWVVKLDQGYSVRSGRKPSPVASETRVYLRVDPRVKLGLQLNFGDEVELQGLSEDIVQQIEQGEGLQAFLAAHALEREGYWPDDYAEEDAQTSAEHKGEKGMDAVTASPAPLNQILFGPPGTGKTYATVGAALEVLDPDYLQVHRDSRVALKHRFDALVAQDRIRFVTFHQSFSYEDFVEGLRATTDEASGQLRYEVVDGVFKSLCEAAAAKVTQQAEAPTEIGQRRIWKMSLGNTLGEDASIYQECLAGRYVLLGYGGAIDFSGCSSRQHVQERFAQAGVVPANPTTDYGITSVTAFVARMKVGDLIVVSDGNFKFRAIGEVSGDYQFKAHPDFPGDYSQMRPVKWLRQYQPSLPHTELLNAQFSQMTLYELRTPTLDQDKLKKLLGVGAGRGAFAAGQVFGRDYQVVRATADLLELKKPNGNLLPFAMNLLNALADGVREGMITLQDIREKTAIDKLSGAGLEPYLVNGYNNILAPLVEHLLGSGEQAISAVTEREARVLIIDEINRGNITRIFGELITLIETSKRDGAAEGLSVTLPYSKERFTVSDNVYLIGTMNTADRSLAGLDIALRRRFVFREMPPRPELLDGVMVEQAIDLGQLLRVMNQRIEVLLDRDHCLGHAYFMSLKSGDSLQKLEVIFRNQILPLLQEYFFEDWQRIQWVLNDHRKPAADRFVEQGKQDVDALFGNISVPAQGGVWRINSAAFQRVSAYAGVIAVQAKAEVPAEEPEEAGA